MKKPSKMAQFEKDDTLYFARIEVFTYLRLCLWIGNNSSQTFVLVVLEPQA